MGKRLRGSKFLFISRGVYIRLGDGVLSSYICSSVLSFIRGALSDSSAFYFSRFVIVLSGFGPISNRVFIFLKVRLDLTPARLSEWLDFNRFSISKSICSFYTDLYNISLNASLKISLLGFRT